MALGVAVEEDLKGGRTAWDRLGGPAVGSAQGGGAVYGDVLQLAGVCGEEPVEGDFGVDLVCGGERDVVGCPGYWNADVPADGR